MRLLIDTNRYAAVVGNAAADLGPWQRADEIWLSLISVAELLAGFAQGMHRSENEQRLDILLKQQGVGVLIPDFETAKRYAEVQASLRRQGTPIPTNDIWIAAQALQHDLALDTRDGHFRNVPGLTLI